MKNVRGSAREQLLVLGIVLCLMDIFFGTLLWLIHEKYFIILFPSIFLFSILLMGAAAFLIFKIQRKQNEKIQSQIDQIIESEHKLVLAQQQERRQYEEFIESWVHEVKTPLSLMTLLLANRKEEMSPYVYQRMEHVYRTIYSDVEKILYYARLSQTHKEYRLEQIDLSKCIETCMESYEELLSEKKIQIQLKIQPLFVISDEKILLFCLGQLLNNAIQYTTKEDGLICITTGKYKEKIYLSIKDNGSGTPKENLPFLFDKGFTGNDKTRKKATGMGLYLVKEYAKELSIDVALGEVCTQGEGFEVVLYFPVVEQK